MLTTLIRINHMARTATVQKDETKEQKSVRLAKQRMGNVLRKLKNIGNLGGSGYALTDAQKSKITTDLQAAVDRIKDAFAARSSSATTVNYDL